jgi:hypothetical protein
MSNLTWSSAWHVVVLYVPRLDSWIPLVRHSVFSTAVKNNFFRRLLQNDPGPSNGGMAQGTTQIWEMALNDIWHTLLQHWGIMDHSYIHWNIIHIQHISQFDIYQVPKSCLYDQPVVSVLSCVSLRTLSTQKHNWNEKDRRLQGMMVTSQTTPNAWRERHKITKKLKMIES